MSTAKDVTAIRELPERARRRLENAVGNGFLFKEGGGAGFHSELRLYPAHGAASIVIANASEIDVKRLLTDVDGPSNPGPSPLVPP